MTSKRRNDEASFKLELARMLLDKGFAVGQVLADMKNGGAFGGAMTRTIVKPKKTSPKPLLAFTTANDYILRWVICRPSIMKKQTATKN
ncbi:MAG: hypothetical protein K2P98_03305 [Neisseriaceae bacterium]|nr:hypothetical protein [Neisseriaceae bacterium]